jgi:methylated-DNA-[protein]-cysteine S-methyltransferase
MTRPAHYTLFDSALGVCGLAWSERGITRLLLPQGETAAIERRLARSCERESGAPPPAIVDAMDQVRRYGAGERIDFRDVTVDLAGADEFRLKVYAALRRLGFGETTTYGELARTIGAPDAAREVGQALGRNPVPVIIPCHRILAAGGRIGGFSAPGGSATKERLLALEGLHFDAGRTSSQAAFDFL